MKWCGALQKECGLIRGDSSYNEIVENQLSENNLVTMEGENR